MTDRLRGVYVAFADDYTIDDAMSIIGAIRMVRGVLAVREDVAEPADFVARARARQAMRARILDVLVERRRHPRQAGDLTGASTVGAVLGSSGTAPGARPDTRRRIRRRCGR